MYIEKPSTYRMVMFYHNPSDRTIVGKVTLTPDDPSDTEQVGGKGVLDLKNTHKDVCLFSRVCSPHFVLEMYGIVTSTYLNPFLKFYNFQK